MNKGVCAPKGFKAAGVYCGIRKNKTKKDLGLIYSERMCSAACVYTQNKVQCAPIAVTRENVADGRARALICNSGIANACAAGGLDAARGMCLYVAEALGISAADVVVASTGVIGPSIPMEAVRKGIPVLVEKLSAEGGEDFSSAIMTTDTFAKQVSVSFEAGGVTCMMGGTAKGSGMIAPNMATMLAFITTDAALDPAVLQIALNAAVQSSFNMISVDGDTSTNDMLTVLANGAAGNKLIEDVSGADFRNFFNALGIVCAELSKMLAKDGEGATKLIEVRVSGAENIKSARILAKSVVDSNLVKAAMFGADANWGRVLCALGYSGAEFDPFGVSVSFKSAAGEIQVCEGGAGIAFDEDKAKKILLEDEVKILVSVGRGEGAAVAWGCDLTYDYVKINGDYRT
ncbi:MAG: bifunctional ornithine acetyltransferase/N-acetylglutamate synthase [Oscillospiraceae bacterium]|jgi:glutamate N-acetyltransferase/amino-acid N-acetyltransferase|nr:bifunctional ornithine acetyltransferase/N-acetylglutamate synthase [Oscillospiraceae bacterium]